MAREFLEEKIVEGLDSDDLNVLEIESNDTVLDGDELSSLISQNDSEFLISYKIDGLLTENNKEKYKNKLLLLREPPTLSIKSSDGDEVKFVLTKEFVGNLTNSLDEVYMAYNGFTYKKNKEKLSVSEYIKQNPLKMVVSVVAFLVFVFLFLFNR